LFNIFSALYPADFIQQMFGPWISQINSTTLNSLSTMNLNVAVTAIYKSLNEFSAVLHRRSIEKEITLDIITTLQRALHIDLNEVSQVNYSSQYVNHNL
jgi:hypothetical protein